jgi:CubicO group peptidase (beta-lactamase class C family)
VTAEAVLGAIDGWGATHAAAAVVGRDGVRATHGELDRTFAVASVTKLVSALAVLVAVEEGTVALDDPAGPPGATVRDLLCHASGLDFDSPEVLAPPRTRRIYSNTGYDALAAHVARRADMDFGEYVDAAVLVPLGMGATSLRGSAAKDLVSTVDDLCRLVAEMWSPRVIDPTTWAEATSPQYPTLAGVLPGWGRQDPCPWGLGPELRGTKHPHWTGATAGPDTYGHFGGSGTFVWVDPRVGVACVVLTDRAFGDWAVEVWPGFSDLVRTGFAET